MIKDKRKARRRQFRRTAQLLVTPNDMHDCVVSDVSDSGARIDVDDSRKLPDRFFLLLSTSGRVQRACRVVWRTPTQLGVAFERLVPRIEKMPVPPPIEAEVAEPG